MPALTGSVALTAGAILAFAAVPQTALSAAKRHADLVVKKGDLRSSKGRLVVGFTIKNTGAAAAPSSKAGISTVAGGKVVLLTHVSVAKLRAGQSGSGVAQLRIPKALAAGAHEISICADQRGAVTEASELNNCLDLGTVANGQVTKSVKPIPIPKPADVRVTANGPATTPTPAPVVPTPAPASTVPTDPVARRTGDVYKLGDSWVFVPDTYDASNQTPIRLLVWMHGCGGVSQYELWNATVGSGQNYLGMAPTGADGTCWDVNASPAAVLAQITALETHFNIDRRRIILGGYSSGGDMAYRMGLDHPSMFAGLLVENTSPFRDSGATNGQALAATPKFPIVHVAHLQDAVYPIATVRAETEPLISDGFPLTRIEVDGGHYDDPGDKENGHAVAGTDADVKTYLLPSLAQDWQAPAG